jgi:hypothetical protein
MVAPFSPEEKQKIISLYVGGLTGPRTAKAMHCSIAGVYRLLQRERIPRRDIYLQISKLKPKDVLEAARRYKRGESLGRISSSFGVDDTTLRERLCKIGIKLRNPPARKTANVTFFKDLDTPRKCYWFGFLCADGSIPAGVSKRRHLSIHLALKDKCILEALQYDLKSSNKIGFYEYDTPFKKNTKTAMLRMGSIQICTDLIKHGFLQIKAGNAIPIGKIPFKNDFLRGYLDGDGSCYRAHRKKTKVAYKMMWCCRYKAILVKFLYILRQAGFKITKKSLVKQSIYYLNISGCANATKIMSWLCEHESFGLKRKRPWLCPSA